MSRWENYLGNVPEAQQENEEEGMMGMFSRKLALLGVAAATAATTALATPGDVTFTNTEPNSTVFTINRHNDSNLNGALVNLWASTGHASQKWRWNGVTLRSKTSSGYCLNLHDNLHFNGATINLWACNGHASQNWVVVGDTLRPASNTNYCVNIHNNVRQNNALINLWQCNGHQSQKFRQVIE
jgi:hypothetical protein